MDQSLQGNVHSFEKSCIATQMNQNWTNIEEIFPQKLGKQNEACCPATWLFVWLFKHVLYGCYQKGFDTTVIITLNQQLHTTLES